MTRAARAIELGLAVVGQIDYLLSAKCPPGKTLADCAAEGRPLDCSGFAKEACKEAGVTLPNGSQQQKAFCHEVPLEFALGPEGAGCFLFMSPKKGNQWPRHVGISIGGYISKDGTTYLPGESLECCGGKIRNVAICRRKSWTSAGKVDAMFAEYKEAA